MSQGLVQEIETTLGVSNREIFNTENQTEAYKIDELEGQKSGGGTPGLLSSRAYHSSYVPEVGMVLQQGLFTPMKLVTSHWNRTLSPTALNVS